MINELLEFARPGALSLQPEDFHAVADRSLGFVKLEIARKHLAVVRDWCEPAPELLLDRNKMEQVLVNVLLNAIHAVPEGGKLSLRTSVTQRASPPRSTTPGPASPHQAKLFEPFFTTKPPGEGAGLGLSVARQIIKLHGGELLLANRPGGGARVTIHIPSAKQHHI